MKVLFHGIALIPGQETKRYFHDDTLSPMDLFHESANLSYPGVVSAGAAAYRAAEFADMHRVMPFQPNKYVMLESKIDLFKMALTGRLWPRAIGWQDYGDEYGHRGNLPHQNVWQFINNEEDYLYCTMIDAWRRGAAVGSVAMARHVMDIDYIDLGRNGLRLILSGAPQLDDQFLSWFAMWYRHIILYLKYADEFGMIDDSSCTMVW